MEPTLRRLCDNIASVIVGKDDVIRMVVAGLLARGHVLIEDAPGLGKTLLARALAQSVAASFKRIQFTPDLLPADVTGVSVYNTQDRVFEFRHGPVFANVLLADEINRTSPRTQSSLLEAMEERQVTVEGRTYPLSAPFFVIATLNPIELSGTFPLPEAQLDRFLMRLSIGYPAAEDEIRILAMQIEDEPIATIRPCITLEDLIRMQDAVRKVRVAPEIQEYIVAIARASRENPAVRLGLSPRGSLAMMRAAQAHAFLGGARFVAPDDVKAVASAVIGHRLSLDAEREAVGSDRATIVDEILKAAPVPILPHAANAR